MSEKKQLGKILLRQRALSPEELDKALADNKGGRLASRLAASGAISDVTALKALSEQHGIPGIDLTQICLRLEDLELLPREIAEKHLILPVLVKDDRLFIAMANPREKKVLDELEFVTGKKVFPYVALEAPLSAVIEEAYDRKTRGEDFYVGPNCPEELRIKVSLSSRPPADGEQRLPSEAPPLEAPGVIVDDEVEALSRSEDVEELAFADSDPELSVVTDMPEHDSSPAASDASGKTILVVDDETEIRKMLTRL